MDNPDFFQGVYHNTQYTPEKQQRQSSVDHFVIDDLLDFPNDDGDDVDGHFDTAAGASTDSGAPEPPAPGGTGNFTDGQFSGELCVPYDDLAELEWLSNFVEESFTSDDIQKMHLNSGVKAHNQNSEESETYEYQTEPNPRATENPMFRPEMMSVPAKARSKRSRAAPCSWTSRLLVVSSPPSAMSSSLEFGIGLGSIGKKTVKAPKKKLEGFDHSLNNNSSGGEGRKCLHCATDKTPQWRTGPLGPKTLCNACGVRYKSGRLVPEYRPAASPTFMLTKHSNSHRKVLELRRQKEMARAQQHQEQFLDHQNMVFDQASSNGDDYLIHPHIGPYFRQLI